MLKFSLIKTTLKKLLYQGRLILRPRDVGDKGPLEGPEGPWGTDRPSCPPKKLEGGAWSTLNF